MRVVKPEQAKEVYRKLQEYYSKQFGKYKEEYMKEEPGYAVRQSIWKTVKGTANVVNNISAGGVTTTSTWLIGHPLQADIESLLKRKICIENDANCFVVSEATDGAAINADIVFGVIISTGTGGGIFIRGQSIIGAIAGEWGHNPLPWPTENEFPGNKCYCGQLGCIETWVSGPGFANDHQKHNYLTQPITAKEIVLLAEQGNKTAQASLQRYEERLAKSLASIINIIDPNVIVLGGGMSNIQSL